MRIPLLAHCPSVIKPGTRCDAIVANIDVAPTLLELAGLVFYAVDEGGLFYTRPIEVQSDSAPKPQASSLKFKWILHPYLGYIIRPGLPIATAT